MKLIEQVAAREGKDTDKIRVYGEEGKMEGATRRNK